MNITITYNSINQRYLICDIQNTGYKIKINTNMNFNNNNPPISCGNTAVINCVNKFLTDSGTDIFTLIVTYYEIREIKYYTLTKSELSKFITTSMILIQTSKKC